MKHILTLEQLRTAHCMPMTSGQPMSDQQVQEQLRELPHWSLANGTLRREYRFGNYYQTIAFVNALAWVVHREDHHPDLQVAYNRVEVAFSTHTLKGISINDFICAARLDLVHGT